MKSLITRADDCGSCPGANGAIRQAARAGFIKNISLMACGEYIEEAAEALRDQKDICFGMHFCVNSEWDRMKWVPVSDKKSIPSLLTGEGEFYPSPELFSPSLEELRLEWRAQLDKLTRLGFSISYADSHMFPERYVPGLREAMSGWIREKGLCDHRYFYRPLPRLDQVAGTPGLFEEVLQKLTDGQYFYLSHPAQNTPDMALAGNAQVDAGSLISARSSDYRFVTGAETLALCRRYGVTPIRYDQAEKGDADSLRLWLP